MPDDRVQQWESGDVRPTIAQLRSAAAAYKRPLAVFFLPEPPVTFDAMRDFRRHPDAGAGQWSPELHGEYRRALRQRDNAIELAELDDDPPSTLWRVPGHRRRVIDSYTAASFLDVKVGQVARLADAAALQARA